MGKELPFKKINNVAYGALAKGRFANEKAVGSATTVVLTKGSDKSCIKNFKYCTRGTKSVGRRANITTFFSRERFVTAYKTDLRCSDRIQTLLLLDMFGDIFDGRNTVARTIASCSNIDIGIDLSW